MTTLHASRTAATSTLHWGRIVAGGLLLELLLFVVLIPVGLAFGMPGVPGATDFTVFFIAVPVGCFVGGYAVAAWMLRKLTSRRALHGALIGAAATLLYLGLCAAQPGGVPAVIAGYGPLLFWASQALRVAGCVLGASHGRW
jgi:hypothetical protein